MKTSTKTENGNAVISVSGRIDSVSAPKLEEEVLEIIGGEINFLTFDFSKLDYISSAGLRVLLLAQKRMKDKKVVIKHPNSVILEIFELTGFMKVLTVE